MKGWYPMKKLVSLGLALVMCLALMIPALATEETFSTENSALVPTVEVELPATGVVVLNPYGMKYSGTTPGITKDATDQILSNAFSLTNKTLGAKMLVKTTVTGTVAGNAQLETGNNFKSGEKGNKVLLKLDYGVTQTQTKTTPTAIPDDLKVEDVQIKDSEVKLNDIVLDAATSSGYTFITFKLKGTAIEAPETPWSESDTVGATFVFTFAPTTQPYTSGF